MLVNEVVGVGGEVKVRMSGVVIKLSARVTMPKESARPTIDPPAPTVIAPAAMIVPVKDEVAPVVTAPLTCQNTLDAWAPLIKLIVVRRPY